MKTSPSLLPARRDFIKTTTQLAAALALAGVALPHVHAAVHTGKLITWEEAMASDFQFCPNAEGLTADSPAPVQADARGRYPAPVPGQTVEI